MKLTKQQRHMAYMIMLAEAEGGEYSAYGFCRIISQCLDNSTYEPRLDDLELTDLPELWAKRPSCYIDYWFPSNNEGWQSRISLLKQCIEETADAWPK